MPDTTQLPDRPLFEVSKEITATLTPMYGAGEARAMTRIIFEHLKGWTPVDMAVRASEPVSGFIQNKIKDVISRLLKNEPIQYIFGVADFYGMKFKVTADTLVPRPETAELVDMIVGENQAKDLRVLDLGTGTGCIAIALARNLPFASVTAADISDKALAVARENARALNTGVTFIHADILSLPSDPDALPGAPFDIIVSNPPYVADSEKKDMEPNVLVYEPAGALFVPDSDPLKFYRAILRYADKALAPDGKIYFEINPLFASDMETLCRKEGFPDIALTRDSFGKVRFLRAMR